MARSAQDAVDTFRVFLRNLPLAFLEPDLEKLCGEYGPTKRIDLIKSMHSDGSKTSKGYAFVKFALEEDAKKAARALNGSDVMGRRIIAELALRKGAKRPEAQPYGRRVGAEAAAGAKMEEAVIDSAPPAAVAPKSEVADGDDVDGAVTTPADAAKPEPQTEQPLHLRTVFAFGIPDDLNKKQLFKRLRKLASVLEVSLGDGPDAAVPKGQTARVVCKSKADAIKLRSKLDGKTMHSHSVMARREVELALWNGALDSRKLKKFRLIVRNLPWEAAEEHLSRAFGKHGPLQEVHIPTVEVSFERKNRLSGEMETVQKVKSRGFAFIQYLCRTDAERVVKDHGVLDILGRSAAVDFALAKKSFEEKPDAPPGGSEPAMDGIEEEGDPDAQEQGEEDDDMDQDDVTGDSGSSDEEEEEKGDDDDDEEEDDEEEEDEDGSSDPKEEADAESSVALQKKKKQISRSNDVAEGCTVFVRNLPFDAESEALRNVFEGRFGPVVHALIVKDKRTGLNKGSAFVKFKNSESVATCIQAGCSGVGISLEDGRPLYVSLAVDREEASKFSAEGAKSHRELVDRRLLYLANEGLLIPDAAAASATPQADMDKRAKARAEKKKKLANPLFFISPLRLSIRNLASGVDDSKLKNICLEAARAGMQQGKAGVEDEKRRLQAEGVLPSDIKVSLPPVTNKVITKAVVMRDMERKVQPEAMGSDKFSSRGFGFVEFQHHAHALAALRVLNNNPAYASLARGSSKKDGKSRLIVEFAVENKAKLKLLQDRRSKQKARAEQLKSIGLAPDGTPLSARGEKQQKLSRGQRQREKKRRRREEEVERGSNDVPPAVQPIAGVHTKKGLAAEKKQKKRNRSEQTGSGSGDVRAGFVAAEPSEARGKQQSRKKRSKVSKPAAPDMESKYLERAGKSQKRLETSAPAAKSPMQKWYE